MSTETAPAANDLTLEVSTRPSNWRGPVPDQAVLTVGCGECDAKVEVLVDIHHAMAAMAAHVSSHQQAKPGIVSANEGHIRQLQKEHRPKVG